MNLSKSEVELFYKLNPSLLTYVNQQLKLVGLYDPLDEVILHPLPTMVDAVLFIQQHEASDLDKLNFHSRTEASREEYKAEIFTLIGKSRNLLALPVA